MIEEETPALARHVPGWALNAIADVLTGRYGSAVAAELLAEMDSAVERATRPLDPEMERQIEKSRQRGERILAELAKTTGLQWKKWLPRDYYVTFDGTVIGYVGPVQTSYSGGRASVKGWRPSLAASTVTLDPQPTVEAAAHAVHEAWRVKDRG